ncbi:MAG: UPF0223 family protein [Kurthia sp.]|nr:UPF0223 family protein [Candidatus Kurthia equi]
MEYSYPFSTDWSTEEIVDIIAFFQIIEKAYETGVKREAVLKAYRRFNEIVPGKAQEKTYFKEFFEVSGYESFPVVRDAKKGQDGTTIKGVISKYKK